MADSVRVTVETELSDATVDQFWALYQVAFEPLLTRSAARQVLTAEEFRAEMTDPRVDKYLAWDGDEVIGLSTLTRHLETVPWISPQYFTARFPEHAARNAIFYLGITLTAPGRRQSGAYVAMISSAIATIVEARGICGYDVSAYHRDEMNYADNLARFIKRRARAEVEVIDEQTYFLADLDQG
ncbi:hypothetical protein [Microlunatus parietis]|uniref:N-acetyltransferase domain-containing protein n=1 Tax=Microlunatus parietis TaxID=682979 RepID=A0A7Y9I5F4_9ACTN|nr:hypothetical protein [Microlunatus parietis]NYE70623.1 hypothetical protein [Microlunatus parietis]